MEEILYELRDHSAGLNAGRWDYIFSVIKKFASDPDFLLPDRAQVTMTAPFMRAYSLLAVKTCHRRGAHAIGGMAAYIPISRDAEVNEVALAKVAGRQGARGRRRLRRHLGRAPRPGAGRPEVFDAVLTGPNQIDRQREDVDVEGADLLDLRPRRGPITEAGLRTNVSVGLQYLGPGWTGLGACPSTTSWRTPPPPRSRAQLWQWIHARTASRRRPRGDRRLSRRSSTRSSAGSRRPRRDVPYYEEAARSSSTAARTDFADFLTLPAYELID